MEEDRCCERGILLNSVDRSCSYFACCRIPVVTPGDDVVGVGNNERCGCCTG